MAWEIYERIYSDNNFMTGLGGGGFVQDYPQYGAGEFLRTFIGLREPNVCTWVFDADEFDRAGHFIADKLLNNIAWRTQLYKNIDDVTRQYLAGGERLRRLPLSTLTDTQLIREVRRITALQRRHHIMSTVANGVVTDGRNHLSNKMRAELQMALRADKGEFEDHWSALTQVTSMSLRQKKDYAMAQLATRMPTASRDVVRRRLQQLHARHCWLDYQYRGPATTIEQFEEELEAASRDQKNLAIPDELAAIRQQQEKRMRELKLDPHAKSLLKLAQFVIWQKGFRKDVQYHSFYSFEALFRELARRKRIDDWTATSFLFPWEVEGFITTGKPSASVLTQRRQFSCLIAHPKTMTVKLGAAARTFWASLKLETNLSQLREARGQCAYAGTAKGKVKIIQVPADMGKMEQGDILVSQATSPDLMFAIRKAAAIVTNTGGLICHAAVISREMKIPCIVGTVNGTLIFKDGDMVEVDAPKGIIKKRA